MSLHIPWILLWDFQFFCESDFYRGHHLGWSWIQLTFLISFKRMQLLKTVLCLTFSVKNKPCAFSSQLGALYKNHGFLHQNCTVHNVHEQFLKKFKTPAVFLRYPFLLYYYYNICMLKYSKVALFANILPSLTLLWNHQVYLVTFLIGELLYSDNVCSYFRKSYCMSVSPKTEFKFINF